MRAGSGAAGVLLVVVVVVVVGVVLDGGSATGAVEQPVSRTVARMSPTPDTGPLTEISSTNPLGHVSREYLDPAWGLSTASVDANGRRADLTYDPLGRLTAAWTPGRSKAAGFSANAVFEYQYNTDRPSVVVTKQLQEDARYLTAYTLYDGLLRERQSQAPSPGPSGGRRITDTFYDSRGLPYKANGAWWSNQAPSDVLAGVYDNQVPGQTITEYDGMGRPTAAIQRKLGIEQWRTTTAYGGDRVKTTPPQGGTATTLINDAQGRTVEKRQHTAGVDSPFDTTSYTYNAAGLLSVLTDPDGNQWRYTYDLRGRLVATDDPDTGHSTVTYDAAGQVLTSTDSHGRTIANAYDDLGRLTAKHQDSLAGTKLASWEYDTLPGGIGLPASSTRHVDGRDYKRAVYGYDLAGRPTGELVTIPAGEGVLGTTYELRQTYETITGLPKSTVYRPVTSGTHQIYSQEAVTAGYNTANGVLQSTSSNLGVYVGATGYSSFGEVLQLTYNDTTPNAAKNVEVTNTYEIGTRRLASTIASRETATGSRLANRKYTYDPAGNITKVADTPEGRVADTQCFAYDHLRRMNEAWTPASGDCTATRSTTALGGAAPYWHSWTFDKTGNRRTETQHATAGDTTRTTDYPDPGTPQPHTARSVTTKGPNGTAIDTFAYDATGRTTSRVIGGDTQKLHYDVEGRVSRVVNRDGMPDQTESTYLYDADGNRLISREPSATTLYVFGQEIRLEKGTSTPSWTRWYSHGGQTVAVRNSITGLKWLIPDHQGTNQLSIANDTALTATQRRQTPYGATRGTAPPAWPDRLGFVGGRNDESGLTQVGARLYDQSSGRFLSADPIIDNNDPQQLNGYAYANNSPVTYSDPTGLLHNCGPDGVLCGYKSSLHQSKTSYDNEREVFYQRQRSWQQASNEGDKALKTALAADGISWEDYQKALADAHKTKWDVIKEVAWEALKDISGWNDIVGCFTKGDIWGCAGLVAGLVPWGKVGKILEAGYNAVKAVGRLAGIVDKAKGVLRRVQTITDNVSRATTERFQKLLSGGGGSCAKHSFVAATLVLMADGSTKPISEVEIGDKVKATDPTTGETTDRDVVATIVHTDEDDMSRLTVTAEDGTTGTVDATSWHPVWVPTKGRFVNIGDLKPGDRLAPADQTRSVTTAVRRYVRVAPVYDLTVEGVHTYFVVVGSTNFLVHNCDTTDMYRVSPVERGSDEADYGLDPANFPRNDELDGAAHFGNRERVEDFLITHGETHGQGMRVSVPNAWIESRGIEQWEGIDETMVEYVIPRELFGEFNSFPRSRWVPKGRS